MLKQTVFEILTIVLVVLFVAITFVSFTGCGEEPHLDTATEKRTVYDLTEEERAAWAYIKWSMYQQVYVRIEHALDDDLSVDERTAIINRESGEYHKNVEWLNKLTFGQ